MQKIAISSLRIIIHEIYGASLAHLTWDIMVKKGKWCNANKLEIHH
ncbi:hypothetical protein TERTU_3687 [Teredinibacter turnerae T7901]|uniref:Uncharacterized protein n=1 Tax=Teredinibacter turnerae (strain ATCC 39867 / T7901) TaxID=377629 RepID=C5BS73_TERTT|nr:hypothetical protein TERTU_3687 [Teredinibacter turnerae T7901]